jgi:uncharacterized protein (DUF1697 family)
MNLGHPGSPDRHSLLSILEDAGARKVKSIQTNGTVLLKANSPDQVIDTATSVLSAQFGYSDAVITKNLSEVQSFLDSCNTEEITDPSVYRLVLTFFGKQTIDVNLPWVNKKGDVDILEVKNGMAFCIIRKSRTTAGNATFEIERLTQSPATTRTISTIRRCIASASDF